ncbi:MAG: hypothetical protein K6E58_02715 [Eubacterium sp.]|nr:hypothetical protein [Eubacterium sp.]
MKTIKKVLAIVLTLAMVLSVAPTVTKSVKAGDGLSIIDIVSGASTTKNPDGTYDVKALKTVKFSLNSFNDKVPGFKQRYLDGKATITVRVYSDTEYTKHIADVVPECSSSNVIEFKALVKFKGCVFYYSFHDPEGGTENLQSELFKIVDGKINVLEGPTFGSIYGTNGFLKKNFTVGINGYGAYTLNDDKEEYITYNKIVKLYKNNKLVATQKTSGYQVVFSNVPVSYGKTDSFKVAMFMDIEGVEVAGPTTTFKSTSAKVPNTIAYATKISSKKVFLRWASVGGVSGYYIYMGKKKVKTVSAKKNRIGISKKKAGKKKFRVVPFVKVGKTYYKSSSNNAKPKKNRYKWSRNLNVKSYDYATCKFVVTKISLIGRTYTVTGYALNNRLFDVKKYKSLKISLKVDGKKAFTKKFKNKKLKLKSYKKKKITFKVKGKAGRDLAWGVKTLTVKENPDWGI